MAESPWSTRLTSILESPCFTRNMRIPHAQAPEPMKVLTRIRPISEAEKSCLTIQNNTITLATSKEQRNYSFNEVFSEATAQDQIFAATAAPMLAEFFSGKNAFIFTYGVTNSGKTYTIHGNKENPGLLPLILDSVFASIKAPRSQTPPKFVVPIDPSLEYMVMVSFIEVYNETLIDLLADNLQTNIMHNNSSVGKHKRQLNPVSLKEDKEGHWYVKGAKEVHVNTVEDALEIVRLGLSSRRVAHTVLNQESSRSHSIFFIKLICFPRGNGARVVDKPDAVQFCKFALVDLAGSERQSRTLTTGRRLKEAGSINASLMTFRKCVEIMRYNQLHPKSIQVVPYRDSKLTKLFMDFFTGHTKALMIVNVNPSEKYFEENQHVLKFSTIAKEVVVNSNTAIRRETTTAKPIIPDITIKPDLVKADQSKNLSRIQQLWASAMEHTRNLEKQLEDERAAHRSQLWCLRSELAKEFSTSFLGTERSLTDLHQQELDSLEKLVQDKLNRKDKEMAAALVKAQAQAQVLSTKKEETNEEGFKEKFANLAIAYERMNVDYRNEKGERIKLEKLAESMETERKNLLKEISQKNKDFASQKQSYENQLKELNAKLNKSTEDSKKPKRKLEEDLSDVSDAEKENGRKVPRVIDKLNVSKSRLPSQPLQVVLRKKKVAKS
eukprot:TRINITY_DN7539_c0_g1_i1.p1 TRINITY_DN7539_c0_g1~~TRINITY_DN7539_c0_g1_i1.p1  ORF type:complete len:667 (-),score=144.54 TRINITY_DN7539_c0_g1_i1:172-2172(-)